MRANFLFGVGFFLIKHFFDDKSDQKYDGEDNGSYDDKFHG